MTRGAPPCIHPASIRTHVLQFSLPLHCYSATHCSSLHYLCSRQTPRARPAAAARGGFPNTRGSVVARSLPSVGETQEGGKEKKEEKQIEDLQAAISM